MTRLVYLVGPRGSGKTTAARLVAARLGWAWADADVLLEERAGMSIREVFTAEGEAGFRDRESAVLRELSARQDHVIATGGGVVLRPENRELLARTGAVVYLTADAETLWGRISADATTAQRRPALGVGGREEVAAVLAARDATYRSVAGAVVETAGKSAEEVAEEVVRRLGEAAIRTGGPR